VVITAGSKPLSDAKWGSICAFLVSPLISF